MRSGVETTDLFRGAFFLCHGAKIARVRLDGNHRRVVSFLIEGEDIDRLDLDYRHGDALVNPLQFRETLNHLRDIVFSKLRENGGERYDRKRENRGSQERC